MVEDFQVGRIRGLTIMRVAAPCIPSCAVERVPDTGYGKTFDLRVRVAGYARASVEAPPSRCDPGPWALALDQLASEDVAPVALQASWGRCAPDKLVRTAYRDGIAYYRTTSHLADELTLAEVFMPADRDGDFWVDARPCPAGLTASPRRVEIQQVAPAAGALDMLVAVIVAMLAARPPSAPPPQPAA